VVVVLLLVGLAQQERQIKVLAVQTDQLPMVEVKAVVVVVHQPLVSVVKQLVMVEMELLLQ
jgi:hypothetical protein